MNEARPDMRKQLLFIALEGRDVVWLDDLAQQARISTQFAARELKRLGWRKRMEPGGGYKRPQNWGPGR